MSLQNQSDAFRDAVSRLPAAAREKLLENAQQARTPAELAELLRRVQTAETGKIH